MDDFSGLLARDFGFKPQGKPTPPCNSPSAGNFGPSLSTGSDFIKSSSSTRSRTNSSSLFDDHSSGAAADGPLFNDVFGGPPKYATFESRATAPPSSAAFDYGDVRKDQNISKSPSMPVYDKPVFDEDIFEGISGIKNNTASSDHYDDVIGSISGSPRKPKKRDDSPLDDLLGHFGRKDAEDKKVSRTKNEANDTSSFDDLMPGFGRSDSPASKRSPNSIEDPFETLESMSNPAVSSSGIFADSSEDIYRKSDAGSRKIDHASVPGGIFDDLDILGKSMPGTSMRRENINGSQPPVKNSKNQWQKKDSGDILGTHQLPVNSPSFSAGQSTNADQANSMANATKSPDGKFDSSDEVWLTVSEIPLITQPTRAPPPSRPPPPRPTRPKRSEFASRSARKTNNPFSSFENSAHSYNPTSANVSGRTSDTSQLDEREDFATGKARRNANGYAEEFSGGDLEANSVAAAAAMKEAMEKAEAKFRHARELREREYLKSNRSKEPTQLEKDDYLKKEHRETQERIERENKQVVREEDEKEKSRLEKERVERERDLARQAVLRANREARERAAAEAHAKAQKAAAGKATAEARERAQRSAVQRVQAEARERAAMGAREKAERSAAAAAAARERTDEAKERETREREAQTSLERAAVQRANAEARERAATQARANQRKDPLFNAQNQRGPPDSTRTSAGASSNSHKTSSATNFADDLNSIFGAASLSGDFREIHGETEERRRARLEREQRTQERAAKALAEKNERDLQAQREQVERHRIGETLDFEIKRWAAGKEGNLRALLSTLQYVLWPECGWQPVSLTELITAASVKKYYRKATLCIHPDKVQQKGANLQQKYIAEKVFDLLKEAWNKLNSEELF